MGIRDTIRNLFNRQSQAPEQVSSNPAAYPPELDNTARIFRAETERRDIVKACRRMYRTDPRVKKAHRTMARDIVRGGFVIRTDNQAAIDLVTQLQTRLNLQERLDDYVRLAARDGDLFLQLIIDEALDIVDISRKPTLHTHRNSNTADEFDQPERAYWMADNVYSQEPPQNAIWFADWEIVHGRWEHDEGERYGQSMFASATASFKRVEEGEMDIAIRRKVGSGRIISHIVEGAGPADLKIYKEENKPALDNPFAAVSHYFFNKKGTIEVTQGDANLPEIGDIEHHIATMFTAGETPMELIAYGQGLNRDVLGEKKDEYNETLDELRTWVNQEIIRPLLERQWLLKGILPASVKYAIEWRSKQLVKPTDIRDIADAGMRLRILGVPETVVQGMLAKFLPGVDLSDLGTPDEASSEQMAAIMQQIRGGLA